jgi:catechol 2,3-dioxygenase-like lactoylglutathione lyase family enzyme
MAIPGAHVIVYSRDADADRRFVRDVLGFPHVDAGGGWLIFKLPPAEAAVHPSETADDPAHELYLMCDDLDATLRDLAEHGVEFDAVSEAGWGRLSRFRLPGGSRVGIYEPRHPRATELDD